MAWCGGGLLCCSAIALVSLKGGPTIYLAWAGLFLTSVCHAKTGYLTIKGSEDGRRDVILFSAAAALFGTFVQAGCALGLASTLQLQVNISNAIWILTIGCIGSLLLVAVALRSQTKSTGTNLELSNSYVRDASALGPTRG